MPAGRSSTRLGPVLAVLLAMVGPAVASARSAPVAMTYHSQLFRPPTVSFSPDPDHQSGDIFLTPRPGYQRRVSFQRGPMIVNGRGQLVWFRNLGSELANNLEVQRYQGKPVLTWWQGMEDGGRAEDVILDSSYHTVAIVRAVGPGYLADTHEFQITPQNTALINVVVPVKANLSSEGGSRQGTIDDCVIQEIDIRTGKLLWQWDALDHVPLRASYTRPIGAAPWDFFHLNSIQQLPNGNVLISARNTWAVYEIAKPSGNLVWTLGGKRSNFSVGQLARFEWQHDARLHGDDLTVFDDASDGPTRNESQSSAKSLILNPTTRTAVLNHRYAHSPPVLTVSQGNAQTLPNQNVFVGWGAAPEFSEYTATGHQIFSGSFSLGVESYRAYRFPWSGQPTTPPAMANVPGPNGTVMIYASWNGATRVAAWRVLGGPTTHDLVVLDPRSPARGFETAVKLHSEPRYFEVQALDSHGRILGTSDPHVDRPHLAIFTPAAFVESSGGQTSIPVGCLMGHDCTVSTTITAGRSTLARASGARISSGTGSLVGLRLPAGARTRVERAPGHRLQVEVTVRDASGASTSTHMALIAYSVSGPSPPRHLSGSPTAQIVSANAFANSSGQVGIVAACYGSSPCHLRATLTADGTVIGTSQSEHLGTDELGEVYLQLTPAGKLMLEHAAGNQLAAELELSNGGDTATGQIDLIGYS
jgi:hypothetical protein